MIGYLLPVHNNTLTRGCVRAFPGFRWPSSALHPGL